MNKPKTLKNVATVVIICLHFGEKCRSGNSTCAGKHTSAKQFPAIGQNIFAFEFEHCILKSS